MDQEFIKMLFNLGAGFVLAAVILWLYKSLRISFGALVDKLIAIIESVTAESVLVRAQADASATALGSLDSRVEELTKEIHDLKAVNSNLRADVGRLEAVVKHGENTGQFVPQKDGA